MPSCVFRKCTNYTATVRNRTDISFHSLPKDGLMKERWIKKIRIQRREDDWMPSSFTKVCSKHFLVSDLYMTKKNIRRLKKLAVPVIEKTPIAKAPNLQTSTVEPDNPEPKQGGFSWEVEIEPKFVYKDEPEHTDDVPDDLSMYRDEDAATEAAKEINRTGWHQGFHCDNCNGDIVGFRYTCVQCTNLDLCVACESSGAHASHYMLRVPGPRLYNEIQTVLARIRKHLMKEFDPISEDDVDNEDSISVKSEIKSEDEEDVEEIEQVEAAAEDTEKPKAEQRSRVSSPESQCSDNTDCEVVSEDNRSVQKQVKIIVQEKNVNENLIAVRPLDNIESTLASTAKRKYIVNLPAPIGSQESNQLVYIQIRPPVKPQTNLTDGNS